ncbi:MAG: hypothetical protein JO120_00205 [Solirubrobacterales bacterium]|nr:hypothetical protein [Solirubrobacterales bacterium]
MEEEWWPRYAVPNLAPDTRRRYLEVWGSHLWPRLGTFELRQITPMVVEDLREQMSRAGVGAQTQRKAMMLLQGVMRRAVVRGLVPANPVQQVPKPKQPPVREPHPLPPETVERIRARMRPRDAMIVSLLAYATSPRRGPQRDLGRRAGPHAPCVRHQDRAGAAHRPARAARAGSRRVAARVRTASRQAADRAAATGGEWTREDWANWRRRVWRPAALEAGVAGDLRPYRLRASFVSLLLWAGEDLPYVAEQAGHSVATLARHYAGVLHELRGKPRVPAAEAIRQARASVSGTHQGRKAEAQE